MSAQRGRTRQHGARWWGSTAIVVAATVWAPGPAVADPAFTIGAQPRWFLLGGVTSGGTVALARRGGYVGGELSLARLREARYAGLYADAYYDFGVDRTYVTAGPELGYKVLGLDGGPAFRFGGGGTDVGVAVRLTVGLGVLGVYVRYAYFDTMTDDHVLQVGGLLKLPLVSPFGGK